ncbi:hypothetical protein [Kribbella sp. NPDC051770]|uniref:hypothetical protein n=1 Tax=Kribbella sp. NPDC051770 TaxID=3155413 RepID=UPI00342F0748
MAAPDVSLLKAYLGESSYTDEDLSVAMAAEKIAQKRRCRVPADDADWPEDLTEALCRRVARNLAMRGIPLAVLQGDAELGLPGLRLPGQDPEVRRLEGPWRRMVLG